MQYLSTYAARSKTFIAQLRRISSLALPMAWSRFIQMLGWFWGMLLVAHLGESYLEASALMSSTMITILVIFMTLLFAVSVVAGRLYGENKPEEIGALLQQAILFAIIAGFAMTCIYYYSGYFLLWTGQNAKLVEICHEFFHAFAWASIPAMLLVALQQCCYGILQQRLVILNNLLSLIVFVPAAYVLIHGGLGIPGFGVAGLAYAIILQNVVNIFSLVLALYKIPRFKKYKFFSCHSHRNLKYIKQLYVVGWPMSVQFGGELIAFFVLTLFTGWVSRSALAASQITQQLLFLVLVPMFAVAESAGILVSQAIGAKNYNQIRHDGNACVWFGLLLCGLFSIVFLAIPDQLTQLYLDIHDPANQQTVILARYLFYVTALMILGDTLRNLYSGALRGFYDTQYPMWLGLFVLWVIAVPLAHIFAFTFQWGVIGIRVAVVVAFAVGSFFLFLRWRKKAKLAV